MLRRRLQKAVSVLQTPIQASAARLIGVAAARRVKTELEDIAAKAVCAIGLCAHAKGTTHRLSSL